MGEWVYVSPGPLKADRKTGVATQENHGVMACERHREEAGEGQESRQVKLHISRASHMHMEYLSRLTTP